MKTKILLFTAAIIFFGCKTSSPGPVPAAVTPVGEKRHIQDIELNGKVYAAIFQQRAGEFMALCIQSFNIAKYQLDNELKQPQNKPLAIVSDIDETIIDNSPYAVEMAKNGQVYEMDTWHKWTAKGIAEPLPGSLEFFNYAVSKGVEVFYITNRAAIDKAGTVANLKKYKFPFADETHVIVKERESSKEARRREVGKNFNIVLLLGDNLGDFSDLFDHKTESQRNQNVIDYAAEFGKRFIVLPNSGYGDWESALFDYNYNRTAAQKDSIYLSKAKGY